MVWSPNRTPDSYPAIFTQAVIVAPKASMLCFGNFQRSRKELTDRQRMKMEQHLWNELMMSIRASKNHPLKAVLAKWRPRTRIKLEQGQYSLQVSWKAREEANTFAEMLVAVENSWREDGQDIYGDH